MITNPLKDGELTVNTVGIGTVTRKMVRERAMELALIDGRPVHQASKADWDQAKQELTGDTVPGGTESQIELTPESERWDPIPGSSGTQLEKNPSADEDSEGQSDQQRLIQEGMAEADHDHQRKAAEAGPN